MRKIIEDHVLGGPVYVFTTFGQVQVGTVDAVDDDIVYMRAPDGETPDNVNLADISGVRPYVDEPEDVP
mgnify:FL=1